MLLGKLQKLVSVEFFLAVVIIFMLITACTVVPIKEETACVLDICRYMLSGKCIGKIAIVISLYYVFFSKNDYAVMIILRQQSKKAVWNRQCAAIVVITAVVTALAFIYAVILGTVFHGSNFNNWYCADSLLSQTVTKFYSITYYNTTAAALFVMILQFFLQLLVTLLLMAAGFWFFNHYIVPLAVVVGVAANDSYSYFVPVFFRRFALLPDGWFHMKTEYAFYYIVMIIIAAALYCAGRYFSERREFISEKSITQ